MKFRNTLAWIAAFTASVGVASAAIRVEPLAVKISEGDGAGTVLLGTLSFDDANLPADLSAGFTVNAMDDDLKMNFPLPIGVTVLETDDSEYPTFPEASFNGDGELIDLQVLVLLEELYVEVLADLSFFYEIGPINAVVAAGSGQVIGGTSAVPVPGAAFLFAPMALAAAGRRFWKR